MDARPILLADDDPLGVELMLGALADFHLGNEIQVVRDGEEALDYLYRRGAFAARAPGNPALFLLDLKMPKMDGLEVLRQIRGEATLRLIPVVILTSSREEQDIAASYALGANSYVVKPLDFVEFMEAIKQLGIFWTVLNKPPSGSVRSGKHE
jgi:CheY-like chemotaxis protein